MYTCAVVHLLSHVTRTSRARHTGMAMALCALRLRAPSALRPGARGLATRVHVPDGGAFGQLAKSSRAVRVGNTACAWANYRVVPGHCQATQKRLFFKVLVRRPHPACAPPSTPVLVPTLFLIPQRIAPRKVRHCESVGELVRLPCVRWQLRNQVTSRGSEVQSEFCSHAKNATPAWNMPILSTRILG